MGAEVIILANPYTYNFLKGLTHSALVRLQMCVFKAVARDDTKSHCLQLFDFSPNANPV